jgi:hypothetical protein
MIKYSALTEYLNGRSELSFTLSFTELDPSLSCHPRRRNTQPGGPIVATLTLTRPHGSILGSTPRQTS